MENYEIPRRVCPSESDITRLIFCIPQVSLCYLEGETANKPFLFCYDDLNVNKKNQVGD